MICFDIANDQEVEAVFKDFSNGWSKKDWLEAYEHCVNEDFGFMYFNFQKPKRLRIMKNFDTVLFHAPEEKCVGDGKSIRELKDESNK